MLFRIVWVFLMGSTLLAQKPALRQFELKAESPRFWKLVAKDAKLDKVAGGFASWAW